MRIDQKLNFAFPVDLPDGSTAHVYSMPIGRAVFETYYDALGKVFTRCFDGQDPKHIALTAPQIAYAALKSLSVAAGNWEGNGGVKAGLINEIVRLTSVVFVGKQGWETLPMDIAVKRGILDEDSEAEVLSVLVFFTSISKVAPKALAGTFLEMAGSLRNWQFTSSACMAFMNSLPTSTEDEPTIKTTLQVVS
jgi:hypothetical protein